MMLCVDNVYAKLHSHLQYFLLESSMSTVSADESRAKSSVKPLQEQTQLMSYDIYNQTSNSMWPT